MDKINLEKTNTNPEIKNDSLPQSYTEEKVCSQFMYGWQNSSEVTDLVWKEIHKRLIESDLIFAYKNTSENKKYYQIVILDNNGVYGDPGNDYSVLITKNDYTVSFAHVPYQYLETEVINDMEANDVDLDIIVTYKQIIEDLK